jgi:hypothetical protein
LDAEDVIHQYSSKRLGIHWFFGGTLMHSLCHVVDKCYIAVMPIFKRYEVGNEVVAHFFGNGVWREAVVAGGPWGYRSGVCFDGISLCPPHIVGYRALFEYRNYGH